MSKGGVSGEVKFAAYIEETHEDWLGYSGSIQGLGTGIDNLIDLMDTALDTGGNPYDTAEAYDASGDLAVIRSKALAMQVIADARDEQTDWEALFDKALEKWNSTYDTDYIDNAVSEFEESSLPAHLRSINRFNAGMSDINAVMGSAYVLGMSMLESDRERQINKFRTSLSLNFEQAKLQYMQASIEILVNMMYKNVAVQHTSLSMSSDAYKYQVIAQSEKYNKDLEINVSEALWGFKVFQNASAVLAAPGGGTPLPEKPSPVTSALGAGFSGAASGATIGAQIGAAGGPIGAGAGALIGGAIGIGAALLE